MTRTQANGGARFPRVGLGRAWRIGEPGPPAGRRVVVGPRAAGECVTVVLQPDPVPVLVGRIVRDRVPVADLTWAAESDGRRIDDTAVRTDHDGRFRVAVRASLRDRPINVVELRPWTRERGIDGRIATWRGELRLGAGTHDLGVLELADEPLVAKGRVVAAGGAAPESPRLHVEAATGDAAQPWRQAFVRPSFSAEGEFAFFGNAPNAALRLVVTNDNRHLPVPPLPFAAGARDLRIELRRGGSVRASIVAGSEIAAFCLQPLLVPAQGTVDVPDYGRFNRQLDPRMARDTALRADGPLEMQYSWPAVAPGRYRFEIRTRGVPRPLHVIDDVIVADGERTKDARLQHLVVPGLRTIEVTLPQFGAAIRDPRTLASGVVSVLDGDQLGEPCWQVDNARVMLASTGPIDVLVRLHGFRDRIVRGVFTNQAIELEPGLRVVLRVEAPPAVTGHEVQLGLEAIDDRLTMARLAVYSAAAGGTPPPYRFGVEQAVATANQVELLLPAPGRYRVVATARGADGTPTSFASQPEEITIGEQGNSFVVQLVRK
jgi:hypothetical protein